MRVTEDEEIAGIDQAEHAESAYDFSGTGGGVIGSAAHAPALAAVHTKKVDA
jgi:Amt family ammonium transporter